MENRVKIFSRIEEIPSEEWNSLALHAAPMLEFEYLHALEKSGSISADRGYIPAHLALYDGSKIIAIAPLYLRDRAWVEFGDGGLLEFLTELTGLPFGSGLVGSIPYTPVPGYDFLLGSRRDGSRPARRACTSSREACAVSAVTVASRARSRWAASMAARYGDGLRAERRPPKDLSRAHEQRRSSIARVHAT